MPGNSTASVRLQCLCASRQCINVQVHCTERESKESYLGVSSGPGAELAAIGGARDSTASVRLQLLCLSRQCINVQVHCTERESKESYLGVSSGPGAELAAIGGARNSTASVRLQLLCLSRQCINVQVHCTERESKESYLGVSSGPGAELAAIGGARDSTASVRLQLLCLSRQCINPFRSQIFYP
ncbi:hypothetical protein J6590_050259 [Homalodisca vitripennis]|nr:hypothetical protein J6590_050259 [Homalodisca vitripennis]